jgi:cytochrome P460
MRHQQITKLIVLAACGGVMSVVLVAQSQDRFSLKASNGIAFSQFKGYEAWQLIATSQHDGDDGCGTSKNGCMKAILGNPSMIQAYRDGFPANGKPVPDGAAMAKVEWFKTADEVAPYQITVPGEETEVAFMVKDSTRFKDTDGWGYATLSFDAASKSYMPKAGQSDPSFVKNCHACHTAGASTTDFVFTAFARR